LYFSENAKRGSNKEAESEGLIEDLEEKMLTKFRPENLKIFEKFEK
jgi:hypothetical protein